MSLIIPRLGGLSPQGLLGAELLQRVLRKKPSPNMSLSQANIARFTPYL